MIDYLRRLYTYLNRDKRLAFYVIAGLLVGFLLLTIFVQLMGVTYVDVHFSEELQEHRNPILNALMKATSWFGDGYMPGIAVGGAAFILYLIHARREAGFTLLTLLSGIVVYGLKIAVNRPRPTADLVEVVTNAKFQSFPSGHVTFYVTFFGFLVFLMARMNWKADALRWTIGLFSLALLLAVPFSRVYLGAHWFTDVLAGFFVGLVCLMVLIRVYLSDTWRSGPVDNTIRV
ncbi:phosphatase PAP2 family protein [Lewinella sp. IMCC34183]|uniref:phosphatase PAP2 family protein n=1 Tax=Lewinella sp. IMCC34183 TaxID=2248762 RepID=UPI000E25E2F9|nr:phosphatase PAP2 family protein [Lewinella sp. IMCC34183]